MTKLVAGAMLALMGIPGSALAQDRAPRRPFTSWLAGPEVGSIGHHAETTVFVYDVSGETGTNRRVRLHSRGLGGGLFGGYDWAVSERLRVGVELSGDVGGKTSRYDVNGGRLSLSPRYGLKLAARLGYVVTPRTMVYGLLGIGGGAYDVRDTVPVANSRDLDWNTGLLVGGGGEYRLDRRLGVRLDYKHVANDSDQLLVGMPVRF